MNVGSVFSGVGGFDLGLERAGMRVVFQCEINTWCRGILAQHWPHVPCYEDVRLVGVRQQRVDLGGRAAAVEGVAGAAPTVDLLAGGFPCQDLSSAGRRAGLAGKQSGLFFEFARVADELVPPGGWLLVENVPGLLTSQRGRDFAVVVRTLGDIGFHDLAWRMLDSRYFGVPQRRRRVYIVARRAAGQCARQVLLEPEGGGGDFETSGEAGSRVAASLASDSHRPSVSAPRRRQHDDENIVGPLATGTIWSHARPGSNTSTEVVCPAPDTNGVRAASGLPGRLDDPRPDGPRYSAMGNAVTVPVIEWIGRRILVYGHSRAVA